MTSFCYSIYSDLKRELKDFGFCFKRKENYKRHQLCLKYFLQSIVQQKSSDLDDTQYVLARCIETYLKSLLLILHSAEHF